MLSIAQQRVLFVIVLHIDWKTEAGKLRSLLRVAKQGASARIKVE